MKLRIRLLFEVVYIKTIIGNYLELLREDYDAKLQSIDY